MVAVFAYAAPQPNVVDLGGWDKLVHVGAYGIFAVLNLRGFHGGFRPLRLGPTMAAVLLTIGYGAFDEWNQTRFVGRDGSIDDWLADLVGALAAIPVASLCGGRRRSDP
jgi:VanZ family protein